jgi:hypothetical protein
MLVLDVERKRLYRKFPTYLHKYSLQNVKFRQFSQEILPPNTAGNLKYKDIKGSSAQVKDGWPQGPS